MIKNSKLEAIRRALGRLSVIMLVFMFTCAPALAAGEVYTKNAAEFILENLVWVIVIIGISVLVGAISSHNVTMAIATFVITAILAGICANPELFMSMGAEFLKIIGLKK